MNTAREFIDAYVQATTYDKFDKEKANIPAFQTTYDPNNVLGSISDDDPGYLKSDLYPLDPNIRERWSREPVAGNGIRLPTGIARNLVGFDAFLNGEQGTSPGGFMEQLSLLLHYSSRATRWEPSNTYQVHRYIASARCLFTCSLHLGLRLDDCSYSIYAYTADDHSLLKLGHVKANEHDFDAPVVICIVGDLAKCVQPYGEFAPNLVAPEAGLLTAQLHAISAALNWKFRTEIVTQESNFRDLFRIGNYGQMPYCVTQLYPQDQFGEAAEEIAIRSSEAAPPRGLLTEFKMVNAFLDALAEDTRIKEPVELTTQRLRPRDDADPDSIVDKELLTVMRQRNSGNYLIGFVPRKDGFDEQCLDRLIFNWIRLARMQGVGQSSVPEIGSYLYVLNLQSGKANQLRVDFEAGKPVEIAQSGDLQKRFKQASTMPMANFAELSVGVAFSCDYQKYMNAYGAFTFNVAHVMTGLLAGSFGLAAAREGRFARPVRMYDDNVFMELFEVEGTPTLQLLCGENRNNQLSFEIG